jgi:hypothetical protein
MKVRAQTAPARPLAIYLAMWADVSSRQQADVRYRPLWVDSGSSARDRQADACGATRLAIIGHMTATAMPPLREIVSTRESTVH